MCDSTSFIPSLIFYSAWNGFLECSSPGFKLAKMGRWDFCSYFCRCGWIKGQMYKHLGWAGWECCATSTCLHLQLLPCMGKSENKAGNCCYHWQSFQENWWLNKRSLKFLAHVDISEDFTRKGLKTWDFWWSLYICVSHADLLSCSGSCLPFSTPAGVSTVSLCCMHYMSRCCDVY